MGWGDDIEAREQAQALAWEHDRKTLAELLVSRRQDKAAALVALAEYRSEMVDGYDGGQYEVTLAVPAALFDQADEEVTKAVDDAANVIVGPGHYAGLVVSVRRSIATPGWDAELIEFIRSRFSELPIQALPS